MLRLLWTGIAKRRGVDTALQLLLKIPTAGRKQAPRGVEAGAEGASHNDHLLNRVISSARGSQANKRARR